MLETLVLSYRSLRFYLFFLKFLPLCYSVWIISFNLYSSSLTLSMIIFILLLSPSSEFLFQLFNFSVKIFSRLYLFPFISRVFFLLPEHDYKSCFKVFDNYNSWVMSSCASVGCLFFELVRFFPVLCHISLDCILNLNIMLKCS